MFVEIETIKTKEIYGYYTHDLDTLKGNASIFQMQPSIVDHFFSPNTLQCQVKYKMCVPPWCTTAVCKILGFVLIVIAINIE